jgi:hypothetical protein
MSLSRKRQKELRKLQNQAAKLWEAQQVIAGEAGGVAREAGRQLGNYNREHVVPAAKDAYDRYAAPYVDRGVRYSQHVLADRVVPTAGVLMGSALSAWDAAGETRARLAAGRGIELPDAKKYRKKAQKYGKQATARLSQYVPVEKKGIGAGGVIAIILGVAATIGVLYAAWQTLRADDELWVADDPLSAPDA